MLRADHFTNKTQTGRETLMLEPVGVNLPLVSSIVKAKISPESWLAASRYLPNRLKLRGVLPSVLKWPWGVRVPSSFTLNKATLL